MHDHLLRVTNQQYGGSLQESVGADFPIMFSRMRYSSNLDCSQLKAVLAKHPSPVMVNSHFAE